MISTKSDLASGYFKRCLATDGFIVMKSLVPFNVGETFIQASSSLLGSINVHMIVAGITNAADAQAQAKRIQGIALRPVDLNHPYYYRIAPKPKAGWNPYFNN